MIRRFIPSSVTLLVLAGCASMPTDLGGLMQSVTSLSSQVSTFTSGLGSGNIADAALKQLAGFGGQAGTLGSLLGTMLSSPQGAALNPQGKQLGADMQAGLGKMSGFKLENLLQLAEPERRAQVDSFAKTGGQVADLAKQLAGMLGK